VLEFEKLLDCNSKEDCYHFFFMASLVFENQ